MTRRLNRTDLLATQEITPAPAVDQPRACTDRTFELPPALHVVSALCYVGFVSVLCLAFASPGLAVPYGVFVAFIAAFFTLPALWTRIQPREGRTPALRWMEFRARGIDTMTGRTSAGEAATLVLILPVLIFCWAIAVAIIAAVVR